MKKQLLFIIFMAFKCFALDTSENYLKCMRGLPNFSISPSNETVEMGNQQKFYLVARETEVGNEITIIKDEKVYSYKISKISCKTEAKNLSRFKSLHWPKKLDDVKEYKFCSLNFHFGNSKDDNQIKILSLNKKSETARLYNYRNEKKLRSYDLDLELSYSGIDATELEQHDIFPDKTLKWSEVKHVFKNNLKRRLTTVKESMAKDFLSAEKFYKDELRYARRHGAGCDEDADDDIITPAESVRLSNYLDTLDTCKEAFEDPNFKGMVEDVKNEIKTFHLIKSQKYK